MFTVCGWLNARMQNLWIRRVDYRTWESSDFGIWDGSWGQSLADTKGRLQPHRAKFVNIYQKFKCIYPFAQQFQFWDSIFSIGLLRYNSPSTQFTHLTCKIQWLLVYSQSCTTIITNYFERFLSPPKGNSVPISSHSHFLPIPSALDNH